jgi:hypothetical protein
VESVLFSAALRNLQQPVSNTQIAAVRTAKKAIFPILFCSLLDTDCPFWRTVSVTATWGLWANDPVHVILSHRAAFGHDIVCIAPRQENLEKT